MQWLCPLLDDATRAADFILDRMRDSEGRLLRVYNEGRAQIGAFLDDHASLLDACLELHRHQDMWFLFDHFSRVISTGAVHTGELRGRGIAVWSDNVVAEGSIRKGSAKEWEVREVRLECSGGLQAVVFR